jgi:hypothetical protein
MIRPAQVEEVPVENAKQASEDFARFARACRCAAYRLARASVAFRGPTMGACGRRGTPRRADNGAPRRGVRRPDPRGTYAGPSDRADRSRPWRARPRCAWRVGHLPSARSCSPTSRRCRATCATSTASRSDLRPRAAGRARLRGISAAADRAFLSAEDKTFFSHGGIDYPGLAGAVAIMPKAAGERAPRRLDHHPAGRQEPAARRRIFGHPQDQGSDPRPPHRECADQGADPRALPQPDLPRPERLWRAGRGARLFRQGRRRADAARRPPISRSCPRRRAITIPSARRQRALERRNCARRDGAQRLHHRRQRAAAQARAARHHPCYGPSQQRQECRRLFHGGSAPPADRALWREDREGAQQRLCRRPVGAHLL